MEEEDEVKKGSPSRSRSASYSPLPPKSPPKQSPSRSPLEKSRSRSRSRSRSPSIDSRGSRSPRRRSRDRIDAYSVQVTGLTRVVTESHLEHIFAFYGAIDDIVLPIYRHTGENKGNGWIVYRSSGNAQKAEEHMDGGQIDGVVISVRQDYMPEENRQRGYRAYNRDDSHRDHRGGRGRY